MRLVAEIRGKVKIIVTVIEVYDIQPQLWFNGIVDINKCK